VETWSGSELLRLARSYTGRVYAMGFFLYNGPRPRTSTTDNSNYFLAWETSIVGACFGPTTDRETIRFFGFLVVCSRVRVCLWFNFPWIVFQLMTILDKEIEGGMDGYHGN
jgi:hypothetical protein